MTKIRALQIARAKGAFELVEREMPEPRAGEVRVRVWCWSPAGDCRARAWRRPRAKRVRIPVPRDVVINLA